MINGLQFLVCNSQISTTATTMTITMIITHLTCMVNRSIASMCFISAVICNNIKFYAIYNSATVYIIVFQLTYTIFMIQS